MTYTHINGVVVRLDAGKNEQRVIWEEEVLGVFEAYEIHQTAACIATVDMAAAHDWQILNTSDAYAFGWSWK